MFRKILVATDRSWLAQCAARAAVALGKGSGGSLVALSVAPYASRPGRHANPRGP